MPTRSKKRVSPEVAALLADLALRDGQVGLSPAKLKGWLEKVNALAPGRRRQVAVEVVAIATRFIRSGEVGAAPAIAQLLQLTEALVKASAKSPGWGK